MQWLKILRKFGSITSTFNKSPILFCTYLGYLKSYRNVSVFKICVWILVFRRKKQFVDPLHGLQVTRYKRIQPFFFKHPVEVYFVTRRKRRTRTRKTRTKITPHQIYQQLLTQFWPNFKRRLLGTSRKDSNCHSNICPDNICPGGMCPHQEYISCYCLDLD